MTGIVLRRLQRVYEELIPRRSIVSSEGFWVWTFARFLPFAVRTGPMVTLSVACVAVTIDLEKWWGGSSGPFWFAAYDEFYRSGDEVTIRRNP